MRSKAWGWFAVIFQMFVGYVLALNAYQIGKFVNTHSFTAAFIITIIVDILVLWSIVKPNPARVEK